MRRRLTDGQIVLRSLLALLVTAIATIIAFVVPVFVGGVLCHFLCGPGPNDFNPYFMYGFFIGLILSAGVAIYGLLATLKPWVYPYTHLKDGHCIDCGYNLRGLAGETDHCPECGLKISPDK